MSPQLPLEEIINQGLSDLAKPDLKSDIPALLVSIGAPRLRILGYFPARTITNPEQKLYTLLSLKYPDRSVHSLYNSWIRRLVSFERAAACAKTQQ